MSLFDAIGKLQSHKDQNRQDKFTFASTSPSNGVVLHDCFREQLSVFDRAFLPYIFSQKKLENGYWTQVESMQHEIVWEKIL